MRSHVSGEGLPANEPDPAWQGLIASYQRARHLLQQLAEALDEEALLLERTQPGQVTPGFIPQAQSPPPEPRLLLLCLGRFRIRCHGAVDRALPAGKPAAILKFLASRGHRPTPRDLLLEALWPDSDADSAANRLRVALHELRRLLAPAGDTQKLVTYNHGCFTLSPNGHLETDADTFEALWREGLLLERQSRPEQAMSLYQKAEDLYKGDYLEEDLYEEWTQVRREALRDAHLEMVGRLAVWSLAQNNHEDCLILCQKLLLEDPCREDAYRMIMTAHAAAGRPARVERWYQICVDVLHRELDQAPSPETLALRARLRRDRS